MTQPVDPEIFLWCSSIYGAAANRTMIMESPANKPVFQIENEVYSFTDIPVNRGMLAVTKELRDMDVTDDQRASICTRIMHFGEIFDKKKLRKFIKKGDSIEQVFVSEALIRACAEAKFKFKNSHCKFDISELARIAQRITDEEPEGAKDEFIG